jgi:hypothetical protein
MKSIGEYVELMIDQTILSAKIREEERLKASLITVAYRRSRSHSSVLDLHVYRISSASFQLEAATIFCFLRFFKLAT